MASTAAKGLALLLGRCRPCGKHNAAKVQVTKMDFDQNLLMYFKKNDYVFAFDPEKKCKSGDVVLIRELPEEEKITTLITYAVEKIVFKYGDVVDPITGKTVVVGKYRDQVEESNQLFGKSDSAFDYSKAPPRGRLEGKRDFTDKDTLRKYHDDGKHDPYAW